MTTLFLITLFVKISMASNQQTLQEGATGCDVTKAAIDQIVTADIFTKKDNFLFARVALVSDFGAQIFLSGAEGIWQTTQDNLDTAKDFMRQNGFENEIKTKLCIDFENVVLDDMRKPLVSLTCAALLVEGEKDDVPIRDDVDGQIIFWKSAADIQSGSYDYEFEDAADTLDRNDGRDGTGCFKCTIQPTDLIFVLDESNSISEE